ncbi:MAG: Two-component transcriptional response regulator, LuxR family, partial [uncultured Solirubrobacteraceae bacterium]
EHPHPHRRRPRHRARRPAPPARAPARHGGGRRGRRRRRGVRVRARGPARRLHPRRLDAAHDRPAGRAADPLAPARHGGADPLHARRRALPVRRPEGRRGGLRAQARGRHGAARRGPRRRGRRGVPHQRRRAVADPRVDERRVRGPRRAPLPPGAGGPQADRRGLQQQADRRDAPRRGEDGRVAPRQPAAQARDAGPGGAGSLCDPARAHRGV